MSLKLVRRAVQAGTLVFIIGVPVMAARGVTNVIGSMYSYGIGPVWITDPLGALQVMAGAMSFDLKLFLSVLIPVLLALVLGRVFCGWMCPQNTLSELFDYLAEVLRVKRIVNPAELSARPRYVVLGLVVAGGLVLGLPLANMISAPGIVSLQLGKYVLEGRVGMEIALIAVILLVELVVIRRAWCNYVCPIGGFLGLMRTPLTMSVHLEVDEESPCGKCRGCASACRLGLDPMSGGLVHALCHNCGDCVDACRGLAQKRPPLHLGFGPAKRG